MDGSPPLPPEQLRFNVSISLDVGEFFKGWEFVNGLDQS